MTAANWVEYIVSAQDAEERSSILFDHGALGVEVLADNKLKAFFQDPSPSLKATLTAKGFTILQQRDVPHKNWTGECDEMWEPARAGKLTVQPVESIEAGMARQPKDQEVLIIPGLGFGTGHHTATQHILHLLQALPQDSVKRALDVGTGSGVLAIAITKMFNAPVLAVDTDPLALENASDNVAINRAKGIELVRGGIEGVSGEFNLIVANLYAELLIGIADKLFSHLAPEGTLIVSGIVEDMRGRVEAAFPMMPRLRRLKDGWAGLLFIK